MSLTKNGVPSADRQDPIGFAVSVLNRLAQTNVLDRLGLRKQTEQAVFSVTRSGFRTMTAASRTFSRTLRRGNSTGGWRSSARCGRSGSLRIGAEGQLVRIGAVLHSLDPVEELRE